MKHQPLFSPFAALVAALCALAGSAAFADPQLDLRAELGYDSNVFDLNESVGERDGLFSRLEANFSAEHASPSRWGVGVDAGAAAQLYESGVTDGDEGEYFVRLRGDAGGEDGEPAFDWRLRFRRNDATYVSRFTGVVATDAARNEIGDRFDNEIGDLRAAWHARRGDGGQISLEGSVVDKNYLTDYASLGLDRLDYQELGLTPEYRVERADSDFRISLPLALRQYRDRRVSDASGNPVADTDLEYRYYGVDARYQRELTRTSALEIAAGYDLREDNGGFDDRTRWDAGVEWTYRPASQTRFSVELEWSSRVFDRPPSGDPTINDEAPEKRGYSLIVQYVRPFLGSSNKGVSLVAETRWESFDSSDDVRYSYDRLQAFVGIRKEFE